MNKSRRQFVLTGSVFATSILTGCITKKLFKDGEYSEKVSSVLISQNGRKLVVITDDYHYIFDAPEVIVNTLNSSFQKSVSAKFRSFRVDSSRVTTGEYSLMLDKNASDQEKEQAKIAGYNQYKSGQVIVKGNLVGLRYDSNNILPTHSSQKLNKTYSVHIVEEQTATEKAVKSLATPVTVAADGIILLGMIPLFIFTMGLFAVACNNNGCK